MKDIPVKVNGNTVSASEYNSATQEEKNLVTDTGQTLNEADNFQVSKSVSNYAASGDFYTDSGSANAYILSAQGSKQNPTAYVDGLRTRFVAANTNTTTATVNVGGLGVKSIKTYSNHDLVGGEIQQGVVTNIEYDGTNFRLATHSQNIITTSFINGMLLSNNVGDPQHDIDISVGSCSDAGNAFILVNRTAGFSKRLDATWTEGSGNGGRASAVPLTADTWYHNFGISKVDGTFDGGYDTAINASNLLSDASTYNFYKYLGSILTDGSSNIIAFVNFEGLYGRIFLWDIGRHDVNTSNPGIAAILATISVPPSVNSLAIIDSFIETALGAQQAIYGLITSPQVTDTVPSDTNSQLDTLRETTFAHASHAGQLNILTDTNSRVRYRISFSDANVIMSITTRGWYMQ